MLIAGSKSGNKLASFLSKTYDQDLKKHRKEDVIRSISEWLRKQPHLPRLSEEELLVFLYTCQFSAEKAKETIDNYFTFRMHAPELFTNRDPKNCLSPAFGMAYFALLPEESKSRQDNMLVILRLRDCDPAHSDFFLQVKTCLALLDFVIGRFPFSNGLEVIMDMEGLTLTHVLKMDLTALRKFMNYVQDAMPLLLRAVHVINTVPLVHQIMAIMRPLIKADLFELIRFHSAADFDSFVEKFVSLRVLPSDYGGDGESLEKIQERTYSEFLLATDWLKEQEDYKVDESKRMGKSKWSEMNGIEGTFKKLEID